MEAGPADQVSLTKLPAIINGTSSNIVSSVGQPSSAPNLSSLDKINKETTNSQLTQNSPSSHQVDINSTNINTNDFNSNAQDNSSNPNNNISNTNVVNINGNNNNGAGPNAPFTFLSTSMDTSRDARIQARKSRIEANRIAKIKPDKTDEAATMRKLKADVEKVEVGKVKKQIINSKNRIESIRRSGYELVTNVRVSAIYAEGMRRSEELKKKKSWALKKQEIEDQVQKANSDIQTKWEEALNKEGPYELNRMLTVQKEGCDLVMSCKNSLINEYITELKIKDDEYVKELKRQAEEIDRILELMDQQYEATQTALKEELDLVEQAFMEERTKMIQSNIKEIEQLLETRRQNENNYLEERANRLEEHVNLLEKLRVDDAEEYNLVKIKLETDVQVLEQQLQQMRATYQLNTEKLEYNYQVLKKRDDENTITMNQQKRKITRLTDILNSLKAKFVKQEKSFQQEYLGLTEDYKRITEQFKELQKKFRHFKISDSSKYKDIWKMNEEQANELILKVIQADKIVYEQQLGLPWQPPKQVHQEIWEQYQKQLEQKEADLRSKEGSKRSSHHGSGSEDDEDDILERGHSSRASFRETDGDDVDIYPLAENPSEAAEQISEEITQTPTGRRNTILYANYPPPPSDANTSHVSAKVPEEGVTFLEQTPVSPALPDLPGGDPNGRSLNGHMRRHSQYSSLGTDAFASSLGGSKLGGSTLDSSVQDSAILSNSMSTSQIHVGQQPHQNIKIAEFKGYSKLAKQIFQLLCDEAGFLVEEKLRKLLMPLHQDEQSLMKLDSIFKALGIDSVEGIEKLTGYFVTASNMSSSGSKKGGAGAGIGQLQRHASATNSITSVGKEGDSFRPKTGTAISPELMLIPPEQVIPTLSLFLDDLRKEALLSSEDNKQGGPKKSAKAKHKKQPQRIRPTSSAGKGSTAKKSGEMTQDEKAHRQVEKEYWESMTLVINDENQRIWEAVFKQMEEYNSLLTDRFSVIQDIQRLTQQNAELKQVLRQYMSAKINDDLRIPPTKIFMGQQQQNKLAPPETASKSQKV